MPSNFDLYREEYLRCVGLGDDALNARLRIIEMVIRAM